MFFMTSIARARPVHDTLPRTAEEERELRKKDQEVRLVNVSVSSVVPELKTVVVNSDDGDIELHLSARVCPVPLHQIHEGQKLVVLLQGALAPRVLQVSLAET